MSNFYVRGRDESLIKKRTSRKSQSLFDSNKFTEAAYFSKPLQYDKDDIPIAFHTDPLSLRNLAITAVRNFPFPNTLNWTVAQLGDWLGEYGYPHYKETFQNNRIDGSYLMYLDASALCQMNIKNFSDIRRIMYGVRCLLNSVLVMVAKSSAISPELRAELFNVIHIKTIEKRNPRLAKFLWSRMKLLVPNVVCREHWEILDRWLNFEDREQKIFVANHGFQLYKCKKVGGQSKKDIGKPIPCKCMPPCQCHWTERETRSPWKLSLIEEKDRNTHQNVEQILSFLSRNFLKRYIDLA